MIALHLLLNRMHWLAMNDADELFLDEEWERLVRILERFEFIKF